MHNNRLLTPEQVAERLQMSAKTLARWRWAGEGPKFVKLGRCVRYRPEEIERFITAGQRQNTTGLEMAT